MVFDFQGCGKSRAIFQKLSNLKVRTGLLRKIGQQKTPHPFPGAGFLESSPDVARRALTRTSVANEKYEYKDEKRNRTRTGKPGNQRKLVVQGRDAGGAALRHNPTLTNAEGVCQLFFWICREIGAISRQTSVRKARRLDAFAANSCTCNYLVEGLIAGTGRQSPLASRRGSLARAGPKSRD